ncbi:MAG: PaaI family thioesterase [Desulfobacterales bacterium]|nr:PaaI family thioesterase [Desulfobacterales bacterium]
MSKNTHYRKLEAMYNAAPTNRHYLPSIKVEKGRATVQLTVRDDFFHSAGALHGSVYFKMLDDAAFFAANSLVTDVMLVTIAYNVQLMRPVTGGVLTAVGEVTSSSQKLFFANAVIFDSRDRKIAYGAGTFTKSSVALQKVRGYQ